MPQIILALLMLCSDMESREERQFAWSAEQGADLSCGYSTLATFLSGYWGRPASEAYLIAKYGDSGTVSIRDLIAVLAGEGFDARAYRMDFGELGLAVSRAAPVIVHFDRPEGHFALVLDIRDDFVVVSDPALGTLICEKNDFLGVWSGVAILARPWSTRAVSAREGREALVSGQFRTQPDLVRISAAVGSAWDRLRGIEDSVRLDGFGARKP